METHFNCRVDYEEDRYTIRGQLTKRFNTVREKMDDNDLIFFTQNDDHPYIDINNDVILEGVGYMAEDPHPYKSMYVSHWPEVIKLSIKQKEDIQVGNFIKFNGILCDSIQIFNVGYLSRILYELIPEDTAVRGHRIDCAIEGCQIFEGKNGIKANIYIPLRELCIHFDGYNAHGVNVPPSIYPCLALPFENNNFNFSNEQRVERMTAHHRGWNVINTGGAIRVQSPDRPVPQKYIDTMLKSYNE